MLYEVITENEEDEDLPRDVAEVVREGDEVRVHREQHQLDRHQQNDDVLAVEEDADHRDREQQRAEDQKMRQREGHWSFSAGIEKNACPSVGACGGMYTANTIV